MSRIAVMADIHANPFALEAVIKDLQATQIDEVIVAGDLVGRGPLGAQVVERVRSMGWPCVKGNHEDYLINFFHERVPAAWLDDEHWAASRWMAKQLGASHIDFIESLPFSLSPKDHPSMLVVHGTTRSNQEGIGDWTSDEDLHQIFDLIDPSYELLICAHTHRALIREVPGRGTIVNVGSVGLPFNGDWRAQYGVFTSGPDDTWEIELRQVPYDRAAFLSAYKDSGFLEAGNITSAMLFKEVEHARPFLVPFLRWAEIMEHEPGMALIPEFLDLYDCERPIRELMAELEAAKDALKQQR